MELTQIGVISISILPLLFAITLHEVAHGWVAHLLGDNTAKKEGRLSLNPLHHIDLLGTIILPVIMLAMGGIIFGWAKPVPVDWGRLKNPKRDVALVAVAGPAANLLMAIIWACVLKAAILLGDDVGFAVPMALMGKTGIGINCLLMVLNLLPLLPLDGGRIVDSFLPARWSIRFSMLEPYGLLILLLLLTTGLLGQILTVPTHLVQSIIYTIIGL